MESQARVDLALWALDHLLADATEACVMAVMAMPTPRSEAAVAAALRVAMRETNRRVAALAVPPVAMQ